MLNQRFDNSILPMDELELEKSGHLACPGCGTSLAMRIALKSLGKDTIVVIPACCWSIIAGPHPQSSLDVPIYHTAFETAAAVASGVKSGLTALGNNHTTVIAWAGDGGTFDIGFQALSGAAERNENIIYVCYDNEAYMNTGIQRSGATPLWAWTTTTPVPKPKEQPKKPLAHIIAAHRVPYVATATVAFPHDLFEKFEKAKKISGFRFIHILSPCPPGWKSAENLSIEITRLAVESKIFPLFEVENGLNYKLSYEPSGAPVKEYLEKQGRFKHLTKEMLEAYQKNVEREWELLMEKMETKKRRAKTK